MSLLHHTNKLKNEVTAEARAKAAEIKRANDDLADEGWFPHFAKFVLFGALILLNIRLFITSIGGPFGVVVALAAVMSGCFAVYCWNRVDKSAGNHLWTMRFGAIFFTLLEILHATASVWEMTLGLNDNQRAWADLYSHKIAFPLMAFSLVIGFAAHRYTHWRAQINQKRAETQIILASEDADLELNLERMEREKKLARGMLNWVEEMTSVESDTIAALQNLREVRAKGRALETDDDPEIRRIFAQTKKRKTGYINGADGDSLPN